MASIRRPQTVATGASLCLGGAGEAREGLVCGHRVVAMPPSEGKTAGLSKNLLGKCALEGKVWCRHGGVRAGGPQQTLNPPGAPGAAALLRPRSLSEMPSKDEAAPLRSGLLSAKVSRKLTASIQAMLLVAAPSGAC